MACMLLPLLLFFILEGSSGALSASIKIPLWKSRNPESSGQQLKRGATLGGKVQVPAYPRSYGEYSLRFSMGSPPQEISVLLDTGSSMLWTPCSTSSASYSCQNCTVDGTKKLVIYNSNKSSTVERVPCRSPKCRWIPPLWDCSKRKVCPDYDLIYGSGSTSGEVVSDVLGLSKADLIPDFLFGCSLKSIRVPDGIAGFGRGLASVPKQLGLSKFSHCFVSHRYDESGRSGNLVLETTTKGAGSNDSTTKGVSYAPFVKSPDVYPISTFYYLSLSEIWVGGVRVRIPPRYMVISAEGDGGVIVDSGSTYTYMERLVFEEVAGQVEKLMSSYKQAKDMEDKWRLRSCYDITGQTDVELPKMQLFFKGGATMDPPLMDYFSSGADGRSIVCMTLFTNHRGPASPPLSGPFMILGNYQQQNFYIEYDLEKQRFGWKPHQCHS